MNLLDVASVPSDRRIETSRVVPWSPAIVFGAFADPTILAEWWGPDGFTNTFYEFEFRDGGGWRFTMHSPDGHDFLNESRFIKIVPPALIVFDHLCAPRFQTFLTFEPVDGGCRIDWRMVFNDAATREDVVRRAGNGLEQNLNRLSAKLKGEPVNPRAGS